MIYQKVLYWIYHKGLNIKKNEFNGKSMSEGLVPILYDKISFMITLKFTRTKILNYRILDRKE